MRPLFERHRPLALPAPAGVAFSSPQFRAAAVREILRVDPRARIAADPVGPALPDALAFTSERPFGELARELKRSATFTRHVQPIASAEEVGDLEAITRAIRRAREAGCPARIDLVGLPRALRRRVLRESAPRGERPPLEPASPPGSASVLSALVVGGRLYLGCSRLEDALSPWAGGDPGHPIEPVSRAASKLREALEHLRVAQPRADGRAGAGSQDAPLEPGIAALDLGAAPGGFTSVLLAHGARVLAVDPAPLHSRLAGAAGLSFFRGYAQDLPLALVPPLDLITCDAVCRPSEVARFVSRFAERLASSGRAIVTLKLRPRPAAEEQLEGAAALFAPALELVRTRHLFANRCEVTAFLRRGTSYNAKVAQKVETQPDATRGLACARRASFI